MDVLDQTNKKGNRTVYLDKQEIFSDYEITVDLIGLLKKVYLAGKRQEDLHLVTENQRYKTCESKNIE